MEIGKLFYFLVYLGRINKIPICKFSHILSGLEKGLNQLKLQKAEIEKNFEKSLYMRIAVSIFFVLVIIDLESYPLYYIIIKFRTGL